MEWLRIIHASYYFLVVTASNTLFRQHSFDDVKTTHLEQIDLWTFFVVAEISKASCTMYWSDKKDIIERLEISWKPVLRAEWWWPMAVLVQVLPKERLLFASKHSKLNVNEWREKRSLCNIHSTLQSMYKQLVDVDVFKFKNHECSATHEICQKFYMAGFLGQKLSAL